MSPQILVLSSSSPYIALNLKKDLKERPFTRLGDLEEYIGAEQRKKPFLLIMEVANSDDVDRALIAYEWAETVDPQAPARFLILAAKHITFDDRQARLRGLELAFLPVNNRNLLFKVDLQLKLLEAAAAAAPRAGSASARPGAGFTAELTSLPGKPGRVMVLRGPERGGWKKEVVPGAKVRWRWIDAEGASPGAPADSETKISWAAESELEPVREESISAWVLAGEEADVKAFHKEKELFSARKVFFAKEAPEPAAEETEESTGLRMGNAAAGEGAKVPSPGENRGKLEEASKRFSSEVSLPTNEIETNFAAKGPAAARGDRSSVARGDELAADKATTVAQGLSPPAKNQAGGPGAPAGAAQGSSLPQDKESLSRADAGEAYINKNNLNGGAEAKSPAGPSIAGGGAPKESEAGISQSPSTTGPAPQRAFARLATGQLAEPSHERATPANEEDLEASRHRADAALLASNESRVSSLSESGPAEVAAAPKKKFRASAFEATLAASTKVENYGSGKGAPMAEGEGAPGPSAAKEALRPAAGAPPAGRKENEAGEAISNSAASTEITEADPARKLKGPRAEDAQTQRVSRAPEESLEFSVRVGRESEARGNLKAKGSGPEAEAETRIKAGVAKELEARRVHGHQGARGAEGAVPGRAFYLMSLGELGDQNSSWQPASSYRIYLSARHRYYGFRHETELFPLWVYEGELAPEFLEQEAAWRFYDRKPAPFFARDELPGSLADELFRLMPKPNGEAPIPDSILKARALSEPAGSINGGKFTASPAKIETPAPGFFHSFLAVIKRLLGRS